MVLKVLGLTGAGRPKMTIFMHCENTPKKSTVFVFTVSCFIGFPTILTALAFQSSRFFGGVLFWDISIYFHGARRPPGPQAAQAL